MKPYFTAAMVHALMAMPDDSSSYMYREPLVIEPPQLDWEPKMNRAQRREAERQKRYQETRKRHRRLEYSK